LLFILIMDVFCVVCFASFCFYHLIDLEFLRSDPMSRQDPDCNNKYGASGG
jgi:hypothetical protein